MDSIKFDNVFVATFRYIPEVLLQLLLAIMKLVDVLGETRGRGGIHADCLRRLS